MAVKPTTSQKQETPPSYHYVIPFVTTYCQILSSIHFLKPNLQDKMQKYRLIWCEVQLLNFNEWTLQILNCLRSKRRVRSPWNINFDIISTLCHDNSNYKFLLKLRKTWFSQSISADSLLSCLEKSDPFRR